MAKPITIYGTITSPFVNRVVLACRYKGLKHEVYMPDGGTQSPELLRINPFGKIPTIKDGRTVLFESSVILEYLERKYPYKRLMPSGINAEGKVRTISAICENYVLSFLIRLFVQAKKHNPDKKIVDDSLRKMNQGLDTLSMLINPGPFAHGNRLSAADCYAVSALIFLERVGRMMDDKDLLGYRRPLLQYWKAIRKDKIVKQLVKDVASWAKSTARDPEGQTSQ